MCFFSTLLFQYFVFSHNFHHLPTRSFLLFPLYLVLLLSCTFPLFSFTVRRSVVHVAPSNMTGRVGYTVELDCPGSRGRGPDLQWLKDDQPLDPTAPSSRYMVTRSGTLRIVNLRRDDAGQYVCSVAGVAGQPTTATAVYLTTGWCCPLLDVL